MTRAVVDLLHAMASSYHPSDMLEPPLRAGVLIAGCYLLERQLGEGGMGTVWEATHTVTRRSVTMKFLKHSLRHEEELRKRFLREKSAGSALHHPNVVEILDVFDFEDPFSESQFKTMKYRPEFPDRFGSYQDARAFCRRFFDWYNTCHHHSALGSLTPAQVHHGLAGRMPVICAAGHHRKPSPRLLCDLHDLCGLLAKPVNIRVVDGHPHVDIAS